MSGTRHHFIPQFLLRGFATKRGRDASYAWVFHRDREPYNTNVLNIAIEGHFYTQDGSSEIDDRITQAEGAFAAIVERLRSTESAMSISKQELANLFAHFEVRTRHLRQNFEVIGASLIERASELLGDEDRLTAFLLRRIASDSSYLHDDLVRELRARGLGENQASHLTSLALSHLPKLLPQILPGTATRLTEAFRTFLHGDSAALKTAVRNAQLRALKAGVAPEAKVNLYAGLEFTVLKYPTADLPLGDSAVLAHINGAKQFRSFVSFDDVVQAVYLPLTPRLVLCGHKPTFDPECVDLHRAIVRCSFESFFSAEPTPRLHALRSEVAADAILMSETELEAVLHSAFEDFRGEPPHDIAQSRGL